MKVYSVDLRTKIVGSVRKGVSKSEAARRFRVNLSTVRRYLKQLDEEASLVPKKPPGSRPKLWMRAPCDCLRKTSRVVRGLHTNKGVGFSLQLAELR